MTLPAKNCSRIQFSLYSVSIVVCILSAIAVFFAGCKQKEEPINPDKQNLSADVARPEWVAPEDYDYTSSMTAVVKIDLAAKYQDAAADFVLDDQDLLAAFIGDECLGVAAPDEGYFYLYIASPASNSDSGLTGEAGLISLRYYSAHYKNLFVAADAFPFVNDDQKGSYNAPFVPNLEVVTD